jgi:2-polyprenyl-6-methoxyphenol hydroxylase-like FAD-dependent oxidoreductase
LARTALIVGAGIGGLSAGIALRRAGWNIRIFERAQSPRELGFGVGLAPNAIAALRELGLADEVLARSFEPRSVEVRRPDGTVVKRVTLPPGSLGGPMVVALRPALHGALLDAVGLDSITLDHEATGFDVSGGRVTLRTARGDVTEGDLLVGADGVASVIRRTLHPAEPPPKPCGVLAVRGAVHGVLHHLDGLSAISYMGRGIESMVIRASDTGIYWFLSLARALVPPDMQDPAAIVALMSPKFDATFRAVTSATVDMRYDELVDRDPIPFWGKGVVTLLGDAAHPVLPHTGQGAAQAIVDAVTLAKTLEGGLDVEPALRAYEHDRRRKTAALLRQGRRTAWVMKTTNPVASYLREVALRMVPVNTLARFYTSISRRAGTDVSRGRKSQGGVS